MKALDYLFGIKKIPTEIVKETIETETDVLEPENNDEQIYQEVFSAQEVLTTEAERILQEINIDTEESKRLHELKKLGFSNVADVHENYKQIERYNKQKKMKQKIEYYKQEYPFNKFIDEDSVDNICKKYNLILSPVDRFKGDIPEKNQNEIIKFRIKKKDIRWKWNGNDISIFGFERDHFNKANDKVKPNYLQVICPENKLLIDKYRDKIVNNRLVSKDPIILQPVECGYLIITAWLDGEDKKLMTEPEIVNPITN